MPSLRRILSFFYTTNCAMCSGRLIINNKQSRSYFLSFDDDVDDFGVLEDLPFPQSSRPAATALTWGLGWDTCGLRLGTWAKSSKRTYECIRYGQTRRVVRPGSCCQVVFIRNIWLDSCWRVLTAIQLNRHWHKACGRLV